MGYQFAYWLGNHNAPPGLRDKCVPSNDIALNRRGIEHFDAGLSVHHLLNRRHGAGILRLRLPIGVGMSDDFAFCVDNHGMTVLAKSN